MPVASFFSTQTEAIEEELKWLEEVIDLRLQYSKGEIPEAEMPVAPVPAADSAYCQFLSENNYSLPERLVLALCMAGTWQPQVLVPFIREIDTPLRYLYGGIVQDKALMFVPTLKTVIFLLAGDDVQQQALYFNHFHSRHPLFTRGVVTLKNLYREQNRLGFQLHINDAYLEHFFTGNAPQLDDEENFPAKLSQSKIDFEDLVLNDACREQLQGIIRYLEVRRKLFAIDGVRKLVRSSYVAVFTGEPGTGKTITAKTIGKKLNIPVYVVNLARVVSKYIGETEKNLERIFDRFNDKDCILFFDEADALFGKRTEVKDSKDRYANQEVAFLLQKIEDFNGVIILASNVHDVNVVFDKAFQRRIRRSIEFEFPERQERLELWKKSLPAAFHYTENLVEQLADHYQLTGASINNIIAEALVEAVFRDTREISFGLLEPCMEAEYKKTGRKMQVCRDDQVKNNPQLRFGVNYMRGNFG